MQKVSILLVLALLVTGAALGITSLPSQAQFYGPPPATTALPPQPWVGQNTPWVYHNGDWFLNGVLYYFFGPKYGWAPYYAYAPAYIVRPGKWYGPYWNNWYRSNPVYWQNFRRSYPYWRNHRAGYRYDERFYNRYHHGQGGGWQHGYHWDH